MGDIVINLLKWTMRITFVIAGIFAFIVVLNLAVSMIFVTLNQNVLSDLLAMVQIWLPFNLNVVFVWLIAASTAFIAYKLSVMAISWINRLLGL